MFRIRVVIFLSLQNVQNSLAFALVKLYAVSKAQYNAHIKVKIVDRKLKSKVGELTLTVVKFNLSVSCI